jgi:hypothetical protein
MRRLVLVWKMLAHEKRLGAHIVNYADDFVIGCRGKAKEALVTMQIIMTNSTFWITHSVDAFRRRRVDPI